MLASDCLSVVQRITGKEKDRSFCGAAIQDIRELISSFSACSLVHVRREQNVAPHFFLVVVCGVVCPRIVSGKQFVLTLYLVD